MRPAKHNHNLADKNARRSRIAVLKKKCVEDLNHGRLDAFSKHLLTLSLLASDKQWDRTIAFIERSIASV